MKKLSMNRFTRTGLNGQIGPVAEAPWKLIVEFQDSFIYSDAKKRSAYTIKNAQNL